MGSIHPQTLSMNLTERGTMGIRTFILLMELIPEVRRHMESYIRKP